MHAQPPFAFIARLDANAKPWHERFHMHICPYSRQIAHKPKAHSPHALDELWSVTRDRRFDLHQAFPAGALVKCQSKGNSCAIANSDIAEDSQFRRVGDVRSRRHLVERRTQAQRDRIRSVGAVESPQLGRLFSCARAACDSGGALDRRGGFRHCSTAACGPAVSRRCRAGRILRKSGSRLWPAGKGDDAGCRPERGLSCAQAGRMGPICRPALLVDACDGAGVGALYARSVRARAAVAPSLVSGTGAT